MLSFYSGEEYLCGINWINFVPNEVSYTAYDFRDNDLCPPNQATSMRIKRGVAGTSIKIYASEFAALNDDYMTIKVKQNFDGEVELKTFEEDYENDHILARYYRRDGLNGNVTFVTIEGCGCL